MFVGDHKAKDAKPRPQDAVKVDEVTTELTQIAQGMSDKSFVATINERCRTCAVKSSCPIQTQGQAVIGK